jgi:hypothetical protein
VLDIDTIDAQQLCAAVDRLWDERAAVRERLAARIPAMRSTLQALPALLQQSLASLIVGATLEGETLPSKLAPPPTTVK